jgi:hypothetical protein
LLTRITVFIGSAAACSLQVHAEAGAEGGELFAQRRLGVVAAGEAHAHEEQARVVVVVLGGFLDVAAAFEQEARNGMHDACPVGAGEGQDVSGRSGRHEGHDCRRGARMPFFGAR